MESQTLNLAKEQFELGSQILKNSEHGQGNVITGIGQVVGGAMKGPGALVQDAGALIGEGAKIPGAMVQGAGNVIGGTAHIVGDVANIGGNLIQGTGRLAGNAIEGIGNGVGNGIEKITGSQGLGDVVKGAGHVVGGAVKGVGELTGGIAKIPGNLIKGAGDLVKGVGHFSGEVLKVPGNLVKGVTQIGGKVLQMPGQILAGISKGVEHLAYSSKSNDYSIVGEKGTFNKPGLNPAFIHVFGKNPTFIDGKNLEKLDKLFENADLAANGRVTNKAPLSKILTLPKDQRGVAVKEAIGNFKDNLTKMQEMTLNGQTKMPLTEQQKKNVVKLIETMKENGGVDQFVEKTLGVKAEKDSKQQEKPKQTLLDKKENSEIGKTINAKTIKDDKKIEPIISGSSTPNMPTPKQDLNIGGR